MQSSFKIVLTTLAGILLGTTLVVGARGQSNAPVYVIIDISKTIDAEAYRKAVAAAEPNATNSAGGRFIVRSSKAIAVDGTAPERLVIIAFESEEQARAWRDSPAIKQLRTVREKATVSREFIVEGLAK